jgi:hypothetical protein
MFYYKDERDNIVSISKIEGNHSLIQYIIPFLSDRYISGVWIQNIYLKLIISYPDDYLEYES